MKKPLVLIGLPGAGKTVTGLRIAQLLDTTCADADQVVEVRLGQTIRSYFEEQGEQAFRDLETQILIELLENSIQVISTGGGVILREFNRERLKAQAMVVFLNAEVDDIYTRLRNDDQRPLLQVKDPLKRLQELKAQRDALYRDAAHVVIDVGGQSVDELARQIIEQLDLMHLVTDVAPLPADKSAQQTIGRFSSV